MLTRFGSSAKTSVVGINGSGDVTRNKVRKPRSVVPGGSDVTATQVDIVATARVGTVFLSTASAAYVDITESSNSHDRSDFSSYGFAASAWLARYGSQICQVWDAKTAHCNNVKGDKDRLMSDHTIAFQVGDSVARAMLLNCATPPTECLGNQCFRKPECRGVAGRVWQNRARTQSATACELISV